MFSAIFCAFLVYVNVHCYVAAWLSGSALVSINVVTLHQTQLVLCIGESLCGWVNRLGITSQLGQLSLPSLTGRLIEYQPFWLRLVGAHSPVSGAW